MKCDVCQREKLAIGGGMFDCRCGLSGEAAPHSRIQWTEDDEAELEVEKARMGRKGMEVE